MNLSIPQYSTEDGSNVAALKSKLGMICDANVEAVGTVEWADALLYITVRAILIIQWVILTTRCVAFGCRS